MIKLQLLRQEKSYIKCKVFFQINKAIWEPYMLNSIPHTRIFSGFKSLCRNPWLCMAANPTAISLENFAARWTKAILTGSLSISLPGPLYLSSEKIYIYILQLTWINVNGFKFAYNWHLVLYYFPNLYITSKHILYLRGNYSRKDMSGVWKVTVCKFTILKIIYFVLTYKMTLHIENLNLPLYQKPNNIEKEQIFYHSRVRITNFGNFQFCQFQLVKKRWNKLWKRGSQI